MASPEHRSTSVSSVDEPYARPRCRSRTLQIASILNVIQYCTDLHMLSYNDLPKAVASYPHIHTKSSPGYLQQSQAHLFPHPALSNTHALLELPSRPCLSTLIFSKISLTPSPLPLPPSTSPTKPNAFLVSPLSTRRV